MKTLKDNELMDVYGGGFNFGLATIIVSGITLIIGILDGIIRPQKCR